MSKPLLDVFFDSKSSTLNLVFKNAGKEAREYTKEGESLIKNYTDKTVEHFITSKVDDNLVIVSFFVEGGKKLAEKMSVEVEEIGKYTPIRLDRTRIK